MLKITLNKRINKRKTHLTPYPLGISLQLIFAVVLDSIIPAISTFKTMYQTCC